MNPQVLTCCEQGLWTPIWNASDWSLSFGLWRTNSHTFQEPPTSSTFVKSNKSKKHPLSDKQQLTRSSMHFHTLLSPSKLAEHGSRRIIFLAVLRTQRSSIECIIYSTYRTVYWHKSAMFLCWERTSYLHYIKASLLLKASKSTWGVFSPLRG